MPAQEVAYLDQIAVLWPWTGAYDKHGQPKVGSPVEINVRWNTNRTEMMDPKGNTIKLDGSAIVGQDVPMYSVMWLGRLVNWAGSSVSQADTELMEVKAFKSTPDLKARDVFRTVGLMRLKNVLPT